MVPPLFYVTLLQIIDYQSQSGNDQHHQHDLFRDGFIHNLAALYAQPYKNPENPCGIRIFGHCKRMKTDEKTDRTGVEKDEVIEKQVSNAETCGYRLQTKEKAVFSDCFMELMTGFEPVTSSLPRMRSTD